jgi:hypothetical protein
MAFTGQQPVLKTDEQLGSFTGYIRRPIPSNTGMTAQIFGENGNDADTILALSLTKYQDAEVFVNIYLIKDAIGQIMKKDGTYPLISSFLGYVKRSMPKKEGMIAQFFAPNGIYADEIAKLSLSDYLDCLVFVDVRGNLAIKNQDLIQQQNIKEIDTHYINKMTKNEKQAFEKREKTFKKMNELLQFSEFLQRKEVLTNLGSEESFQNWLKEKKLCSHYEENEPCKNLSIVMKSDFLPKPFNYLPICKYHFNDLQNYDHFSQNRKYYEMKHHLLLKEWALQILSEKFSYNGKGEPDPKKVIEWAASKNLSHYLPIKYNSIF